MNSFSSIRELLNRLSRAHKLLPEMFERRKSLSYKFEYALEVMEGNEDIIKLLLNKNIIKQNRNLLEHDDQFLKFFEGILEINEEKYAPYSRAKTLFLKKMLVNLDKCFLLKLLHAYNIDKGGG